MIIDEATQTALDENDANDRACVNGGGTCTTPAAFDVQVALTKGPPIVTLRLCPRHARIVTKRGVRNGVIVGLIAL